MRYPSLMTSPAHCVPDVQAEDHLGRLPPGQLSCWRVQPDSPQAAWPADWPAHGPGSQAGRTGAVAHEQRQAPGAVAHLIRR